MKRRMMSMVLALVMVCSLLPLSSVVYAENFVEEIATATSGVTTYTSASGQITITGMFCSDDGFWCDQVAGLETVTISVPDGYVIKTVEALVGWKSNDANPDLAVDHGTLSAPSKDAGSTIRIENVDAPSVTISNTDYNGWTLKHFKVTYSPAHAHSYAANYSFDSVNHWKECTAEGATEECRVPVAHTVNVQTNADQSSSTASCAECGAYLTLSAQSGTTEKTVGEMVEVKSNVPGVDTLVPQIKNLQTKEVVDRNCKEEGNYQASLEVDGQYLIADFTLTNPKTTAATGDNRPIELLLVGFAAMSAMAAAAFTMDRKRR